jgi:hypothetical protein
MKRQPLAMGKRVMTRVRCTMRVALAQVGAWKPSSSACA